MLCYPRVSAAHRHRLPDDLALSFSRARARRAAVKDSFAPISMYSKRRYSLTVPYRSLLINCMSQRSGRAACGLVSSSTRISRLYSW